MRAGALLIAGREMAKERFTLGVCGHLYMYLVRLAGAQYSIARAPSAWHGHVWTVS